MPIQEPQIVSSLVGLRETGPARAVGSIPVVPSRVVLDGPFVEIDDLVSGAEVIGTTVTATEMSEDTRLLSNTADNNFGASTSLTINRASSSILSKILMRPPAIGAEDLVGAQLWLWQTSGSGAPTWASIYRISDANGDWVEGTGTGTAGDPSWNEKSSGVAWAGSVGMETPSVDYYTSRVASFSMRPRGTAGAVRIPLNLVEVLKSSENNTGWLMQIDDLLDYTQVFGFNSVNAANASVRPKIELEHVSDISTHTHRLPMTENTFAIQVYAQGTGCTFALGGDGTLANGPVVATDTSQPIPEGGVEIPLLPFDRRVSIYMPGGVKLQVASLSYA